MKALHAGLLESLRPKGTQQEWSSCPEPADSNFKVLSWRRRLRLDQPRTALCADRLRQIEPLQSQT